MQSVMFYVESVIKVCGMVGMLGIVWSGWQTKVLMCCVQVVALLRSYGLPRMRGEYRIQLLQSEFTGNILYILATLYHHSYLFYLPLLIQSTLGLLPVLLLLSPLLPSSLLISIHQLQTHRRDVILMKHKIEFLLFIYMLLSIFFLFNFQFFNILLYFQFLVFKNRYNPLILISNTEMDAYVNTQIINNTRIFSLTRKIINFFYFKLTRFIRKV